MYDIVIIGGGPMGSAVAYHCAQKQLGRTIEKLRIINLNKMNPCYQSTSYNDINHLGKYDGDAHISHIFNLLLILSCPK